MTKLKHSSNRLLLFICLERDLILLLPHYYLSEFLVHSKHRTDDAHIKSRCLILHFIFVVQQTSERRITHFLRLFYIAYNYNIWFTNINYMIQNLRNQSLYSPFRSTWFTVFPSSYMKARNCIVLPSAPFEITRLDLDFLKEVPTIFSSSRDLFILS